MSLMSFDTTEIIKSLYNGGFAIVIVFLPFIITIYAAALAINFLQVGFVVSTEPFTPNLNKLNPIKGIKKLFKLKNLVNIIFGFVKIGILGTVVYLSLVAEGPEIVRLSDTSFGTVVKYMLDLLYMISLKCALALLVMGLLDYLYQRWQHEQNIKMSKHEVKEELKRFEGDPKIKERRRSAHRQIIYQRMFQKVPKATVVITNPTEIAVALQYDSVMKAPVVVAKGMGLIAEKIRRIAHENDVPIIQRRDLARALYKICEVGQEIPENLYKTVAEILAYVVSLKEAQQHVGAAR